MGRKGFEGIFNLHIVNLFTPTLSSPVNGEERVWKDFLLFELLIYSPPPLSSFIMERME
jgi:hypothetical protein